MPRIRFNAAFLDLVINLLFMFFILSIQTGKGGEIIVDVSPLEKSVGKENIKAPVLVIKNQELFLKFPKEDLLKESCKNYQKVIEKISKAGLVILKTKGLIPGKCINNVMIALAKHNITIYW